MDDQDNDDSNFDDKDSYIEEKVGYKKPPKWTQWPKGMSGNPSGRKKLTNSETEIVPASELDRILRRELDRKITVREGNKTIKFKMIEVVHRALTNQAGKGDVRAQREVIKQARDLDARDAERAEAERKLDAVVLRRMIQLKKAQARAWQAAAAQQREPEEPWPHPDDLIIDERQGTWTVRGPVHEAHVPFYEGVRSMRDQHFAQMLIEIRARTRSVLMMKIAAAFWLQFDAMLPKRWQLAENWENVAVVMLHLPLRQLRSVLAEATRKVRDHERIFVRPGKDTYREVNAVLKPIFHYHGYRSLAEFERAYSESGEAMAWPKQGSPAALKR